MLDLSYIYVFKSYIYILKVSCGCIESICYTLSGISTLDTPHLQGILHTFPPCDFAQSKLLKAAPTLNSEPSNEDYLVMILVKE